MPIATFWKAVFLLLLGCAITILAPAQTYTVLYSFSGTPDGAYPEASLILDSAGNLHGTTFQGGASNAGSIFRLSASGAESLLYSFTSGADGGNPSAPLVIDAAGDLYGTTQIGGDSQQGVAFKFSASATNIHVFTGRKDGASPFGGFLMDSAGHLFGTTTLGGSANRGTVFRLDPSGIETVLHSFHGPADGGRPCAGLIQDAAGNLYGTTYGTGAKWGTIFKLTTAGVETVLHNFTGKDDGGSPYAGLTMDSAGSLYGATVYGGAHGAGAVFKFDPGVGRETVLHSFSGGLDGGDPYGTLLIDSAGNLYGTTYYGGTFGYGTIFKLDPAGNETVLHSFTGGSDGLGPMAGLVRDAAGNLYGTTIYGGAHGFGVVFKITP